MHATPDTMLATRLTRKGVRKVIGIAVAAGLMVASLTGCSAVSEIVAGEVSNAACAVGSGAIEQVATDVTAAVGNIAVDPAAALAALTAAEAALGVAVVGLTSEPAATAVENARATLGELVGLVQDASDGVEVDQAKVEAPMKQFSVDLAGVC